jgi:Flp pilus assembly protein protease CpaA
VKALLPYIRSSVGIVICVGLGVFITQQVIDGLGWDGLGAAFASLFLTLAIAFALFAAGVALRRALFK